MSARLKVARAYERSLFAGDPAGVASRFTDDIVYWVAGAPRLGGEWRGREAVLDALWNREPGLGAADWGYEDVSRQWYEADVSSSWRGIAPTCQSSPRSNPRWEPLRADGN